MQFTLPRRQGRYDLAPPRPDAISPSPNVEPGTGALPSAKRSRHADRGLSLQPSDRRSHTVVRRYTHAEMPMLRPGLPLDHCATLLLAQCAHHTPATPSQWPLQDAGSVLGHHNDGRRARPSDGRWAWPCSPGSLLAGARGGALPGGSLRHVEARRNGRACASLTARGGGLPYLSYMVVEHAPIVSQREKRLLWPLRDRTSTVHHAHHGLKRSRLSA